MIEELKPCPFCGGVAEIQDETTGIRTTIYFVECLNCVAGTQWEYKKENAIKAWNTRK